MLTSLTVSKFSLFNEAKLDFTDGLNVIVGENSTGKSHLLKLVYVLSALQSESSEETAPEIHFHLDERIAEKVDFLALRLGSGACGDLFFIEVKDFSGHESRNRHRLLSGRLVSEVVQKVRDTVSGLYAARRWNIPELRPFTRALFHNQHPPRIQVVLFLEERKSASQLFPYKRRLADQIQLLNTRLRPFRAEGKIYNSKTLPSNSGWKAFRFTPDSPSGSTS